MSFFVYILRSLKDGTYYVGSTQNVEARLERHNQGRTKYTKVKRPWVLILSEEYNTRNDAVKREREIKSKKRVSYIEELVRTSRM